MHTPIKDKANKRAMEEMTALMRSIDEFNDAISSRGINWRGVNHKTGRITPKIGDNGSNQVFHWHED